MDSVVHLVVFPDLTEPTNWNSTLQHYMVFVDPAQKDLPQHVCSIQLDIQLVPYPDHNHDQSEEYDDRLKYIRPDDSLHTSLQKKYGNETSFSTFKIKLFQRTSSTLNLILSKILFLTIFLADNVRQ